MAVHGRGDCGVGDTVHAVLLGPRWPQARLITRLRTSSDGSKEFSIGQSDRTLAGWKGAEKSG